MVSLTELSLTLVFFAKVQALPWDAVDFLFTPFFIFVLLNVDIGKKEHTFLFTV